MPTVTNLRKKIEFQEFVEWLGLPSAERDPKNQVELAKKLGVDKATLSDWKKVEGFWQEVKSKRKNWVQEKVSNVLLGLYGRSLKGDAAAAKMLLEYSDEFIETKRFQHSFEELDKKEKEEIKKAIDFAYGRRSKGDNNTKRRSKEGVSD